MPKRLLLPILFFTFATAVGAFVYLTTNMAEAQNSHGNLPSNLKFEATNLVKSPIDTYFSTSLVAVSESVGQGDARPVIVDNFLAYHHSPMAGLGQVFVEAADKYSIDYRLLPAIAFQESTLGKYIPRNSHNAFGWAIYTGATSGAKFKNWEQAINTVALGLKTGYIDQGLTTPEQIMQKYSDDDAWAFGVNFAMEQMTEGYTP